MTVISPEAPHWSQADSRVDLFSARIANTSALPVGHAVRVAPIRLDLAGEGQVRLGGGQFLAGDAQ